MSLKKKIMLLVLLVGMGMPQQAFSLSMSLETMCLELSGIIPTILTLGYYGRPLIGRLSPRSQKKLYGTTAVLLGGAFWWRYLKAGGWDKDPNIAQEVKDQIKARLNGYMSVQDRTSYMKWLAKYPFGKYSEPAKQVSIEGAREQLNSTHVGIEYVKEPIIDYLAGIWASNGNAPKVLCLDGAPGTGKTTLGASIAEVLDRKFAVINVAGLRASELSGSKWGEGVPGALASALIRAGSLNPVVLVDELEKAEDEVKTAFLSIFDPSQNNKVRDSYLGFDMDLSRVTFVATVNDLSKISEPLRNRMQIIHVYPYSIEERRMIARQTLIKQVAEIMNLDGAIVSRLDGLIDPLSHEIMKMEGGMRAFKRCLTIAAEKYVRQTIELKELYPDEEDSVRLQRLKDVTCSDLLRSINPELLVVHPGDKVADGGVVGVVNTPQNPGLSGVGGVLQVEAIVIPHGSGVLMPNLQDEKSYRNTQQRVFAYVKTIADQYGIKSDVFKNNDFIFADQTNGVTYSGNWTGLAHAVALVSALTRRPVKQNVAVMGAIDMHGNVLPSLGNYREKVLGVEPAGVTQLIAPVAAKATLETFKASFPTITIHYVATVPEALELILEK